MLDLPMSTEPPITAAEVAEPLFSRCTCTSSPFFSKTPPFTPYSAPTMSASGVPATRSVLRSAAAAGKPSAVTPRAAMLPARNAGRERSGA